jgi:hypothetical protein
MHYVVIGSPISDIGKGRLSACIASIAASKPLPVKVDPFLNRVDPSTAIEDSFAKLSTDLATYTSIGLEVSREQCIVSGNLLFDFLFEHTSPEEKHLTKRLTQTDAGEYLAKHLSNLLAKKGKLSSVIEVGGSIEDSQMPYISYGIRKFAGDAIRVVLLSYVDFGEDKDYPFKTRHVVEGIQKTYGKYGTPYMVFFRNRKNSIPMSEEDIELFRDSVARKALYPKEQIVYLPEFQTIDEQRKFLESRGYF